MGGFISGTTNLLGIFASSAITNQDVYWSANTDGTSISPSGSNTTTNIKISGDTFVKGNLGVTGGTYSNILSAQTQHIAGPLGVSGNTTITGNLKIDGATLDFTGLPTSDPSYPGRLWNDSGTMKISNPFISAFTFTMNTENAGSATKTFVLPLVSDGSINILVDWGDSSLDTITTYNQSEITHVYSSTGTYTIQMAGTIRGWKFNYAGDKAKILNISQWGDFNITQTATFRGCTNLSADTTDAPTIGTDNLTQMFEHCCCFKWRYYRLGCV